MSLVLLQLGFETFEQRERVSRCTRKACKHLVVVEPAYLFCCRLDDDVAERYLTVAAERDRPIPAHRQNGRAVKYFHQRLSFAVTAAVLNARLGSFLDEMARRN